MLVFNTATSSWTPAVAELYQPVVDTTNNLTYLDICIVAKTQGGGGGGGGGGPGGGGGGGPLIASLQVLVVAAAPAAVAVPAAVSQKVPLVTAETVVKVVKKVKKLVTDNMHLLPSDPTWLHA